MKKIRITLLLLIFIQSIIAQSTNHNSYNLMPWPKEITSGQGMYIIKEDFTISLSENSTNRLYDAATRFLRRLSGRTGVFFEEGFPQNTENTPSLMIKIDRVGELKLNEDESYKMTISNTGVQINSVTDIGALRGLETLLQLTTADNSFFYFPSVTIEDTPRFAWRGLMIDVARHYQPLDVIKRNLDAMAAVKLNVFHWHLTDDQGFRMESKSHPKLHELGSDGQYYTHEEIRDIIRYAGERGIRVIPELDVPGHASALLTAYPELGSKENQVYTIERYAGVFDPTLDPTNEKTYELLSDIFTEVAQLFPDPYVHIGGDENEGKHWDENPKIQDFKKKNALASNHDLQTHFNLRLQKILQKLNKKLVGWEEIMTPNMPTTAVIHSWRGVEEGLQPGESLIKAAKKGHYSILSTGYYIDRMHDITHHYLVDPLPKSSNLSKDERKKILGGEVTMWGELVTPLTIDSRIWPRTAAIAERFWSQASVTDLDHMRKRLSVLSFRLEELGLTHLKNRNVILRNIANGYDTDALMKLTQVCQPLQKYSRNKGGTEYKSYSPFTLFADACTTDSPDAYQFESLVNEFISSPKSSQKGIESMLFEWKENHEELLVLRGKTPLVSEILKLSSGLNDISAFFLRILDQEGVSKVDINEFNRLINNVKAPHADVEIAVSETFVKLFDHLKKNEL
ncbi:beta-N-acetylhexosaminidase [Aquimarina sp. D1M17]|uniref:beta-N-acetylhexosaminidase n=1 Tax=Aquimarina acroporae TaxID=2937283 RepID=UPI0020C0E86E|nr:beta-N-acetylhexosaminidase [Aquimarina acroporae]MCK8522949.1 beta-N-acetylhexosaminidase [Aquimarina acroporae]